jgi:hypothetical protein
LNGSFAASVVCLTLTVLSFQSHTRDSMLS